MNTIDTNSTNINILGNDLNTAESANINQIVKKESNDTIINNIGKTDCIEISEKDVNSVNKVQASKALQESFSEFSSKNNLQMAKNFMVVYSTMKFEGYNVPSFNPEDNSNSAGFLQFVDEIEGYVKNNDIKIEGTSMNKSEFYDFCDLYREKLKQYGCN